LKCQKVGITKDCLDFKSLQGEERKKLTPEEIERKRKEAEELGPFQILVTDG